MSTFDGRLQLLAERFPLPQRMPAWPPVREFLTSAGFGGAAALVTAIVVAIVAMFALRGASRRHQMQLEQQERHHQEIRKDQQHAAAVKECRDRLVWVVETAGIEPAASEGATLGLGPELALELLRGLLRDAEQLGDDTLAKAVSVYLDQLSLVLAQQGSPLSELAEISPSATDTRPGEPAASEEPHAAPPPAADELAATTKRVPVGGRRRRQ
jgi:hypothetical protein